MARNRKAFVYSDEEVAFLKSFIPGHSHVEILNEFNTKFGRDLKDVNLKSFMVKYGVNTGFTGHFHTVGGAKSYKPKKGTCPEGSKKSWFKKGGTPPNTKPVGTISVRKNHNKGDSRVFIKIAEPNKWVLYNRWLWEQNFGEIPKGYVVTHKDGNHLNCNINNLKIMRKDDFQIISKYCYTKDEYREAVLTMAEIKGSIRRKRNEEHN